MLFKVFGHPMLHQFAEVGTPSRPSTPPPQVSFPGSFATTFHRGT